MVDSKTSKDYVLKMPEVPPLEILPSTLLSGREKRRHRRREQRVKSKGKKL